MTPRYGMVVTARGPDYGIYMLTVRVPDSAAGWETWDRVVLQPAKMTYTTGRAERVRHVSFSTPKHGWYEMEEPPQ